MPKISVGESFTVALNSGTEKVWIRGGGEYHDIPWNFFCFTKPKNFLVESFSDSLVSGIEKFYASEGYVTIFDFLSKDYCFTAPKYFAGESFSVSLLSGIEIFYASESYVRIFRRKILVSHC